MAVKNEPDMYQEYYRIQMRKEKILKKLREAGFRITRQRITILEIILSGNCSSCKEIYYLASEIDSGIGAATVYRMVNLLEEIGAISRKNQYEISQAEDDMSDTVCKVELDDHSVRQLSGQMLRSVLQAGLKECGYLDSEKIVSVSVREDKDEKRR